MLLNYKCPNCGTDMIFNAKSGYLTCDSCGREDIVSDFSDIKETPNEYDVKEFNCQSCGAVLVTDMDTTSTSCSFCGSPTVIASRLDGSFAPSLVIPFKITKEEASLAFKKWRQKSPLYPNEFRNADRVKDITGMYIPFWLFNCELRGKLTATGTKVKRYEKGDRIYTDTSYYDIYRDYDLDYSNVPVDASEKMDDKLMDKLEPFHYNELKSFDMPYLAGYISEKYNYSAKDLFPRMEQRAKNYVQSFLNSTIHGYSTVSDRQDFISNRETSAEYTLFPVWMFCYDYKNSKHTFAMNGQTGKVVGTPPLSIGRILSYFSAISVSSFLIMRLLTLIGGIL